MKLYWRVKRHGKWTWEAAVLRTYDNPGGNTSYGYGFESIKYLGEGE